MHLILTSIAVKSQQVFTWNMSTERSKRQQPQEVKCFRTKSEEWGNLNILGTHKGNRMKRGKVQNFIEHFYIAYSLQQCLIRTTGTSEFTDSRQCSPPSSGLVSQLWCNKEDSHCLSLHDKHTGTWRNTSSFMSNCTHKYHFNRISTDRANSKLVTLGH